MKSTIPPSTRPPAILNQNFAPGPSISAYTIRVGAARRHHPLRVNRRCSSGREGDNREPRRRISTRIRCALLPASAPVLVVTSAAPVRNTGAAGDVTSPQRVNSAGTDMRFR